MAREGDRASRVFDLLIRGLIAANVVAVVVETVPEVAAVGGGWLHGFEVASVAIFSVEYLLRVWSAPESGRFPGAVKGRLRFAVTPLALVDLFAVLPAYLPMLGVDLRVLRGVRLFRLVRILKIVRYSRSLQSLGRSFRRKREELVLTGFIGGLGVLFAATLMYYAEHPVQPEAFGSIPEAMWWGVVTVTTLGYGDVVPVTFLGRLMAAAFALGGILLIALPTAILGGAFVEELEVASNGAAGGPDTGARGPSGGRGAGGVPGSRAGRGEGASPPDRCPHCGARLDGAAGG